MGSGSLNSNSLYLDLVTEFLSITDFMGQKTEEKVIFSYLDIGIQAHCFEILNWCDLLYISVCLDCYLGTLFKSEFPWHGGDLSFVYDWLTDCVSELWKVGVEEGWSGWSRTYGHFDSNQKMNLVDMFKMIRSYNGQFSPSPRDLWLKFWLHEKTDHLSFLCNFLLNFCNYFNTWITIHEIMNEWSGKFKMKII